ncbi:ATP-binding cassette domain-containing protein [Streptomyces afghaniensis]|uniref:ATP-binding cassette domain-containing protein n=1 Tax=Streptomyces afghaniensis TaxID=66865 RepID=UPI002782CD99|nr:sugar ABC transporter ATP-binding protein [Streptomyces afghaniensis]MDQ1013670.1 ribose transport system ATP-binding protein [Streptomyces afghaniensis]
MTAALHGVTKRFGTFAALSEVSLTVEDGEIHALLGANGSGKSTLVRTMTGVYVPDAGRILIDDRDVTGGWSPAAAAAAGVRVVHQEAPLVDRLSIAENVALFAGYPRGLLGHIAWRRLRADTQRLLDDLSIRRRSRELAGRLTGAERAMLTVELAVRTAGENLRLLVLDEATAALPEAEAEPFLRHVRGIADRGLPVLAVTHRLAELAFADRVSVLDAGRVVIEGPAAKVERSEIVRVMRGAAPATRPAGDPRAATGDDPVRGGAGIAALWRREAGGRDGGARPQPATGPVLQVRDLHGNDVDGLGLTLARGEIIGVIGVRGSGLEELPRLLTGAEQRRGGTIEVAGRRLPAALPPRVAIRHGLVFLPADRLREGGIHNLSVTENLILPEARAFWHRRAQMRHAVRQVVSYLDVRPTDPSTVFGRLSGGNQQKVVLGRLLRMRPRVLVLADPTYGVDPAAREVMFDAIRDAGASGIAVLMTSTEPEQMAGLCDRVLVLRDGRVAEEISGPTMTAENLMTKAL